MALGEPVPGEPAWPQEAIRAVPKRVAEFAAGRSAARAALAGLGIAPMAIPMMNDRSPQWPVGSVGTISHCEGACLAVAARTVWAGIGLDLEPDRPLDPALWAEILRPEERDWLDGQPKAAQGALALRVFVAKEAAYKAQFALSRTLFDFQALRVDLRGDHFVARFAKGIPPFREGFEMTGVFVSAGGVLAALVGIAG